MLNYGVIEAESGERVEMCDNSSAGGKHDSYVVDGQCGTGRLRPSGHADGGCADGLFVVDEIYEPQPGQPGLVQP